jgi:uncharacterized RDD family membrane protein YckC
MTHTSGISPLPREARPYQGQRAGLVTRMVASTIDAAVVGLVLCLGYAGLAGLLFLINPRDFSFPDTSLIFGMAAAFTVLVIYLTACWWFSGRTYGDLVMGLRVVNFRGEGMHLVGAFGRAVFCAIFPIGLLWVVVSTENRSAQDLVMRTSVLYDWKPRGGPVHRGGHEHEQEPEAEAKREPAGQPAREPAREPEQG